MFAQQFAVGWLVHCPCPAQQQTPVQNSSIVLYSSSCTTEALIHFKVEAFTRTERKKEIK